jgi:hypothetical protein
MTASGIRNTNKFWGGPFFDDDGMSYHYNTSIRGI